MHIIKFKEWVCRVVPSRYTGNNRLALILTATEDSENAYEGERIATCTINLPEVDLAADEVVIKDYSENEGMLDALLKHELVTSAKRVVQSGFATCAVVKVCKSLVEEANASL